MTISPQFEAVKKAADVKGVSLVAGKGNDGDTLFKKQVWVYDTAAFPFYEESEVAGVFVDQRKIRQDVAAFVAPEQATSRL